MLSYLPKFTYKLQVSVLAEIWVWAFGLQGLCSLPAYYAASLQKLVYFKLLVQAVDY